jgi:dihydrofolate reductase
MRKTLFGVANSLDNFIARPDGGVDWIRFSDEIMAVMKEVFAAVDAVVMGRKTYEAMLKMGSGDSQMYDAPTYVCSRTLSKTHNDRYSIVSTDAVDFVRDLKSRPGKTICVMGGGILARSLFEAGLIDEVDVNIHPVILGSGIPLFLPMRQVELELVETRRYPRDCVGITYRVVRKS